MFRNYTNWCFGLLAIAVTAFTFNSSAQGEALFKAKCASCHQPHKDGTGPKLFEVRSKWADGGAKGGSIYQWVNNWEAAVAADPYAASVEPWSGTAMNLFPDLNQEQIDGIMDWIDEQPVPGAAVEGAGGAAMEVGETEESSNTWMWILLGVIFFIVVAAVGGVRRQLNMATAIGEGKEAVEGPGFWGEFKSYAYHNKAKVGFGAMLVILTITVWGLQGLGNIGVVSGYQPSQPIAFPHTVHAGINGIDCKYCHNSVDKSKTAGLPTVNVCMNCHKQVNGNTPEQQSKIAKIYEAAGYDAEKREFTGKTNPIKWNKVHALPDHVYFPHSQHVVVGGIDCKQCHGDMTKQEETAKIQPVEELNKIEGNVKLTRPTLTMGWCIECHAEKEISNGPIDSKGGGYYAEIHKRLLNNDRKLYDEYLKDGKVTVKELGGWECAKCHY